MLMELCWSIIMSISGMCVWCSIRFRIEFPLVMGTEGPKIDTARIISSMVVVQATKIF